jgi:hypothetical protein
MSKSCLFSFNFQIYFQSSVSFEYFLSLKDLLWFRYRSLIKGGWCHDEVVLYAVCVACCDTCLTVYYVLSLAFFLECACVPTVATTSFPGSSLLWRKEPGRSWSQGGAVEESVCCVWKIATLCVKEYEQQKNLLLHLKEHEKISRLAV